MGTTDSAAATPPTGEGQQGLRASSLIWRCQKIDIKKHAQATNQMLSRTTLDPYLRPTKFGDRIYTLKACATG